MPRLRLLCLHGFRGSGAGLRMQMQGAFGELEPLVELVCPDAPNPSDRRSGWWNAVPIDGLAAPIKHYEGWRQTREAIVQVFGANGPFDGIFGFSQGASLAGLLVGMRAADRRVTAAQPLSFRFAILVSGFVSNDPEHAAVYAAPTSYALPSLHLIGHADRIVAPEASRALAARFEKPQLVEHDGGHVIPSTLAVKHALRGFLTGQSASPVG